ncbi:YbgA family protein [Helcococcus kunzii]|nr:YbgA family protein [Helcococcus kunzii]MCT1988534.1 YbgA family protein [Helcococcus kunzii]
MNGYREDRANQKDIINYLNKLLIKYPNKYLENSKILSGEDDETMASKND